jgi:hypothetical protein
MSNLSARAGWPLALLLTLGIVGACCWRPLSVAADESAATGQKAPQTLLGLPLLYQDDFESGAADRWEPSDPAAWKVDRQGENRVYSQFQASKVKTPVRSPFNRSMIKGLTLGDFVLDVELQSTVKDYGHRDMCLFFGYQDPAHFYYVHLGKKADDHANQIFIVNNADRKKISTESTPGTDWDDAWHHARIVRNVATGAIDVYFDDMEKPVMRAIDKAFEAGQVGVGSFDDTGNFDRVLVYGKKGK